MDSSDGGPLRLFNFGGAHAAGVLAMTALADFYNKHAAGRRMQNPGWAKQASVRFPERGFGARTAPLQKIIGGFVIRHSSRVRGRKLSYAAYAIHASAGMPRRFPPSKTVPLIRSR
jgi:hypothetical protein